MPVATVPGTRVSLLTVTSKMPSRSWSLPAVRSCPSAAFGPGAICGESREKTNCYATRGMYQFARVAAAQEARYRYAIRASMDAAAGDEFVSSMIGAVRQEIARQERAYIARHGSHDGFQPVFRVHDSGDLFSPSYADLWARVCQALPDVKFWIPTRQWRTKNVHMLAALRRLAALDNVAVRPSALKFDDPAPIVDGLAAGTTATTAGFTCPAPLQGNECRDCRACWTKDVEVSYRKH